MRSRGRRADHRALGDRAPTSQITGPHPRSDQRARSAEVGPPIAACPSGRWRTSTTTPTARSRRRRGSRRTRRSATRTARGARRGPDWRSATRAARRRRRRRPRSGAGGAAAPARPTATACARPRPTVEEAQHRLAGRVGVPGGTGRRWRRTPRPVRPARLPGRRPRRERTGGCGAAAGRCDDGAVQLVVGGDHAGRSVRGAASRSGATSTSTSPSSAPASPGCGPRCRWPQRDPALRIAVLERHTVGFGASGRNGGWCSALLTTSLTALADRPRARRGHRRPAGDARRPSTRSGASLPARPTTPGSTRAAPSRSPATPAQHARLAAEVDEARAFGFGSDDVRWMTDDELAAVGRPPGTLAALTTPHCAAVHPLRLVHAIAGAAVAAGVRLHTGTSVVGRRAGSGDDAGGRGAGRRHRPRHRGLDGARIPTAGASWSPSTR